MRRLQRRGVVLQASPASALLAIVCLDVALLWPRPDASGEAVASSDAMNHREWQLSRCTHVSDFFLARKVSLRYLLGSEPE